MAVTVAPPLEGGPSEWQFFPISHALSALQEDGPLTFCILIVASLTGAMVSHGGFLTGGLVCCRSSPDQVPPPQDVCLADLCSWLGPEVGVGRPAGRLHPGGPGSLQALTLQLQNSQTHTLGGQPGLRLGHSIIPVTYL